MTYKFTILVPQRLGLLCDGTFAGVGTRVELDTKRDIIRAVRKGLLRLGHLIAARAPEVCATRARKAFKNAPN